LVMRLESMGHRAATIEDFIRPGVEMGQCATRPDYLISQASLDRLCEPDMARAAKELRYNVVLQEHSKNYVSVDEYQCSEGRCIFIDDLGRPTHRDQHHLSIDGSIYFISRLEEVIRKAI
jgi:SGNH domain (fused to AT3 domains)